MKKLPGFRESLVKAILDGGSEARKRTDTYKTVAGRSVTLKTNRSREVRDSLQSVAASITKNPMDFHPEELLVLNDLTTEILNALDAAHKSHLADIKRSVASKADLTREQADYRSRAAAQDSIRPRARTHGEITDANAAGEAFERIYGGD